MGICTLLFDIDGTLLRTQGAGLAAIRTVMERMFSVTDLPTVGVHGRTDFGIMQDIFSHFDISVEENLSQFLQMYTDELENSLHGSPGFLLPGVSELLDVLSRSDDFAVGLLTGNCQRAAGLKVQHFGISEFFDPFGGYGDHSANRNDVAHEARNSATDFLQGRFNPNRVWVVGDTVNDIVCGRAIGARVMAVETGGASRAELEAAEPDLCVTDLSDIHSVLSGFGDASV